jgi:MATE family multidrug resistance protein
MLLGPAGVEPSAIPIARRFLMAQAPALLFFTVFLAGKTYLQAHGKTRPALVAGAIANVVNVIACTTLVRGNATLGIPALGALGSGIAMSTAAFVLAAVVMYAAWRVDHGVVEPAPPTLGTLARIGMPIGFTLSAEIGVFVLAAVLAGRLGNAVTSAHQIALGVASMTFMGALGVSGATAVRVGRAVGEGVPPRQRGMLGILLGALVMTGGVAAFALAPRFLVALFSNDPEVIAVGTTLVRIAAVFQLFDGVQCVAGGALRGAGDVKFAFAGGVVGYWFVGLPVALLLGFGAHMGAAGIWWGLTVGLVSVSVVLTTRFWFMSGRVLRRVA